MDIGNYCFVNRTIKKWSKLNVEAIETFFCKPKIVRDRVRTLIRNGVK
jgi:hypothetical protein